MSTRLSIRFAVVAVLVGLLCINVVQPQLAVAARPQTSEVYAPFGCLPGFDCDVVGSARLVRTPHGISLNLHTTGLDPNAAYTVWFVVFNNPDACGGCGPAALAIDDVMGSVLWATGHVVGGNGVGNFGAHLAVGDTSGDTFPIELSGDAFGLIDPMEAEIHIVVRSHGPKIRGRVYEQISTFNGVGCEDYLPPEAPNPNHPDACEDQQFAVFPRP